jgi:aminotransferase
LVKEKKVACIPGNAFGPSGEGFLRCCFATSLDKIEIAMERMAAFVSEVRDGGSK